MKFKWPKFCCCLAAATAAAIQKHLNPYFLTETSSCHANCNGKNKIPVAWKFKLLVSSTISTGMFSSYCVMKRSRI